LSSVAGGLVLMSTSMTGVLLPGSDLVLRWLDASGFGIDPSV
jgi:hypothetical protein